LSTLLFWFSTGFVFELLFKSTFSLLLTSLELDSLDCSGLSFGELVSVVLLLLLFSELLESPLNNPVNQCHTLPKNPSTCSLEGKFIASLLVASMCAFSPSKLSFVFF
jgi:hypothetical protein